MTYEQILTIPPFSLAEGEKERLLTEKLRELTRLHYDRCGEYRRMLDGTGFDIECVRNYYDIPFLPVSLFKEMDLLSVPKEEVFKTMTSSGTTGQAVSKVYLDRTTASNQQKTLVKIVSDFTGSSRMPMLIIDSPSVVKDRSMFSARGAGILGFSIFGSDKLYALNEDMSMNIGAVEAFIEKHKAEKILLFGFTFMVWRHFYKELLKGAHKPDLSNGILIHGGGWKKLESEAVSHDLFKQALRDACGLKRVHDYYGMVEQTGCVYMECEHGRLHASVYSDAIVRRAVDFSPCDIGETGIIQVVSMLPESYPGHSLLTEDEGVILGEDDCPCGRKGKYFKVMGRLKNAEIRGCGDTYAVRF
jgi:phenylacetate-coenzyme A ligase PaaK-like adenylate-forming protein